eukprot:12930560-Ditylum_brightwellii.AAC.1
MVHGYTASETSKDPESLQSVGWNDGDMIMLCTLVKEEIHKQCVEDSNVKCKQCAKRTGVEQPSDVCIVFKLLKKIEQEATIDDVPFVTLERGHNPMHVFDALSFPKNEVELRNKKQELLEEENKRKEEDRERNKRKILEANKK